MALLPTGEYRRVLFAALPLLLVCLTFSMLGTMQQNQMIDNKAGIECIDNIFYQGRRIQGGGKFGPENSSLYLSISGGRLRFSDDLFFKDHKVLLWITLVLTYVQVIFGEVILH